MDLNHYPAILFDWGDTVMKDDPSQNTPMVDWPQVEMVTGVETLLEAIHTGGRVIALATGAEVSNETQIREALARVNLDRYFDKIYCFGNTGQRKPSAAFYQFILDDLKVQPAEALMIGDSFEKDVLAANQLGIAGVWFNPSTPETRNGAGFVTVHSMAELQARFKNAG
jgi:putative hydrolase of the HAD superfamily